MRDGRVDREALRRAVLGDPAALRRLEAIVHPLVRAEERRFLAQARRRGLPLVVLDVPLLFETGGERRVDATNSSGASRVPPLPPGLARARLMAALEEAIETESARLLLLLPAAPALPLPERR